MEYTYIVRLKGNWEAEITADESLIKAAEAHVEVARTQIRRRYGRAVKSLYDHSLDRRVTWGDLTIERAPAMSLFDE